MSVAFTREEDYEAQAADLPDRPISPHPNLVTASGLAQIEAELARFAPGAPLRVEVSRLSLFAYASAQIGGRLTRVADFDFATTPPALLTQQTGILPFSWP